MDFPYVQSFLIFLCLFIEKGKPLCYFNSDFQGNFTTQVPYDDLTGMKDVESLNSHYSRVMIELDRIPVWGLCHRKIGHNFILAESTGRDEFCYRCFRMKVRSYNVLQLHTTTLNKCFMREDMATKSCPSESQISSKDVKELILFRHEYERLNIDASQSLYTYCPFLNGMYSFTYTKTNHLNGELYPEALTTNNRPFQNHDENISTLTCGGTTQPNSKSVISNCPTGHVINITFQKESCIPSNYPKDSGRRGPLDRNDVLKENLSFDCLGDWPSKTAGELYVALLEKSGALNDPPRYRCGLVSKNQSDDTISMSLSRDSTCRHNLHSSKKGYETFVLSPKLGKPWPSVVRKSSCMFPAWIEGVWNDVNVEGNTMTYKDRRKEHFKTYTSVCVQQSFRHKQRYLIYSRTNCGEEEYNCVWFESRGPNIMEFQIGLRPSTTPSFELCDNSHFLQRTWNTQARTKNVVSISCPIKGEYNGILPDAPQFCSKMSSDCNNPNIMLYSVSSCSDLSQVYDDREYQCFGQWEEDGLLYTFTKRRDLPNVYECFVGGSSMVTSEYDGSEKQNQTKKRKISIIESGFNCRRGLNVNVFGMPLSKKRDCYGSSNNEDEHPWFVPTTHQYLYMENNTSQNMWDYSTTGAKLEGSGSSRTIATTSSQLTILFILLISLCHRIHSPTLFLLSYIIKGK